MKHVKLIVLLLFIINIVACGSQGLGPAISFPHTVATVDPLQLTIDQRPDGLYLAVQCVGTKPYADVNIQFKTADGGLNFSYG